jgi:hypothetical protein
VVIMPVGRTTARLEIGELPSLDADVDQKP